MCTQIAPSHFSIKFTFFIELSMKVLKNKQCWQNKKRKNVVGIKNVDYICDAGHIMEVRAILPPNALLGTDVQNWFLTNNFSLCLVWKRYGPEGRQRHGKARKDLNRKRDLWIWLWWDERYQFKKFKVHNCRMSNVTNATERCLFPLYFVNIDRRCLHVELCHGRLMLMTGRQETLQGDSQKT